MIHLMFRMEENLSKVMLRIQVMNEFICYNLKFFIENGAYQLYFFHFSTAENVEAHTIQNEHIQRHEVHDVATTSKKQVCNIFFSDNLVIINYYDINLTFLHYCSKSRPLATTSMYEYSIRKTVRQVVGARRTEQQVVVDDLLVNLLKLKKPRKK